MSVTERGSGLGLYICKGIVEGHGGTIEASSPGEGLASTLTIRLPLGEVAKWAPTAGTHLYTPLMSTNLSLWETEPMTTVYDVPPTALITKVASDFAGVEEIQAPEWAPFVKTGIHCEKPPVDTEWWNVRVAAVLRKVYTDGPIGTERLREHFGGYRDRGSKPNKATKGSGSIARKALQQLEAAGLVENKQAQGRVVTGKGRSLMDNASHAVKGDLAEEIPGLAKY
jgi:small subunit ribosomal protein S19e